MAYDLETLMNDVKAIMTSNLNTKISAINTEKGDSTVLDTIPTDAYFLQDLDHETLNYNPFVFYSLEEVEGSGFAPQTPQEALITIIIVVADQGYMDTANRMFRYSRALKEVFEENFFIKSNSNFLNINVLAPVPLTTLNQSMEYRASGIQIKTIIG